MRAFTYPREPSERVERTAWAEGEKRGEQLGLLWFHALFCVTSYFGWKSSILSPKREWERKVNAHFCSVLEFSRSLTREKRGEESERFWSHLAPEGYAFTAFRFRTLARCEGTPKNNLSTGPIIVHFLAYESTDTMHRWNLYGLLGLYICS